MQDGSQRGLGRMQYAVVGGSFLALIALYAIYLRMGYANLFYESQFLHFPFLEDLSAHHMTGKGFFTAYYEHLFPGYNLILAFNYRILHLWGGFDGIVHAVFLTCAAGVVIWRFCVDSSLDATTKTIASVLAGVLLLSTTNTPQWGMALGATGGVSLFALCAALLTDVLWGQSWNRRAIALALIPLSIILFLGGYGIGCVGAICILVVAHVIAQRRVTVQGVVTIATVIASALIYAALVVKYGQLGANRPTSLGINVGQIAEFLVLITGSSILGKAMFEQTHLLWPYYVAGCALIVMTVIAWVEFVRRPTRGRMFVLALSAYSAVNIVVVSFFRYRNGSEGAMGEWYNAQTHFVAVGVAYFYVSKIAEKRKGIHAVAAIVLAAIAASAVVGYVFDWRKGEYVADYKQQFIEQAPVILAFPDLIGNKHDSRQTMLWDYSMVKPTIDFLYNHKLWIFHHNGPMIEGLEHDGWMRADRSVSIICPSGSSSLSFRVWRKEEWPASVVTVRHGDLTEDLKIRGNRVEFKFPTGVPALMLDASDKTLSKPITSPGDGRPNVGIVADITCQ